MVLYKIWGNFFSISVKDAIKILLRTALNQ